MSAVIDRVDLGLRVVNLRVGGENALIHGGQNLAPRPVVIEARTRVSLGRVEKRGRDAAQIAERMSLAGREMQALIAGSFLHDVGKIGIPDAILLKPGKLDAEEMAVMRTHVEQGEQIVKGMGWLDGAHAVVAGHHEKWNGSGYPRALSGEQIPLAARIFAVADVFDALCSKRPYKEPMGFDAAMTILAKDTGSHFDPAVMQVFSRIAKTLYQRLEHSDEADSRQLLEDCVRKHFEM